MTHLNTLCIHWHLTCNSFISALSHSQRECKSSISTTWGWGTCSRKWTWTVSRYGDCYFTSWQITKQMQQMRQKQLEFEKILLSGVTSEQREVMWQTAQEKAVSHMLPTRVWHVSPWQPCTFIGPASLYTACLAFYNYKCAHLLRTNGWQELKNKGWHFSVRIFPLSLAPPIHVYTCTFSVAYHSEHTLRFPLQTQDSSL